MQVGVGGGFQVAKGLVGKGIYVQLKLSRLVVAELSLCLLPLSIYWYRQ